MRLKWYLLRQSDPKPSGYQRFTWYAEGFDQSGMLRAAVYSNRRGQIHRRMTQAEDNLRPVTNGGDR